MLIYIIILMFILVLFFIRNSELYLNSISRYIIFFIYIIALFMICIFRSINVGTDYKMYYSFYLNGSLLNLQRQFVEKGYILLNNFAQNNGNFMIISAFTFIIPFLGFYLLSKSFDMNKFTFLAFFVLTYLYLFLFNALRQFTALGIISIGFYIFIDRYNNKIFKYNKYIFIVLVILLASLFHSSSYFCLIFLLLPKIKFSYRTVFIAGILTILLYVTGISKMLFNKLLLFSSNYGQKYSGSNLVLSQKGFIQIIPTIVQFVILYLFLKFNKDKVFNYKDRFILSGYLLFLVLYSAGGDLIAIRLQTYTYMFPVLFSSLIFDKFNYKSITSLNKIYFKYFVLLFWISYYILRLITDNSGVVPYSLFS